MNKKIKVIDLIDKKYHNLELPKHIRINKLEYFYKKKKKTYDSEYGEQMSFDFTDNVLNREVEILEDNTEEIEELKGLDIHTPSVLRAKINELVKAVNSIRKDKNND